MATTVSVGPVRSRRAAVFKALGEPTRLRMVDFLRKQEGEVTGRELAERAGISLALLCHHADALVEAGVVFKRKERQTSYWRINTRALADLKLYLDG